MKQSSLDDYRSTDKHPCPSCERVFTTRSGLGRHHSLTHGEQLPERTVPCSTCGEELERSKNAIENNIAFHCSDDCMREWRAENWTGESHPDYDPNAHPECTCKTCGDVFLGQTGNPNNYCSRECYHDSRRGSPHPGETKGKVAIECDWCGEDFEVWPKRGEEVRFCGRECTNKWRASQTGPDHPLWKGGTDWYRLIRSATGATGWHTQRKRHLGDECELCGGDERLTLHHIVPVLAGGVNGAWNYMTVCQHCHRTVEDFCRGLPGFGRILAPE